MNQIADICITEISILNSLQISQPLLNNLKVQILDRKHRFIIYLCNDDIQYLLNIFTDLDMEIRYKPHTPRLKIVDNYIRELFRDELPSGIKYHDADHTLHPTRGIVAIANRIAISENISEYDRELLITAAYFHDTGYIREYDKNEPIAARMAGRILKLIGYKPDEVVKVQNMILSTDLEREPKTHLEEILCDADLDHFGREDFFKLDGRLREGRRSRGIDVGDDAKWYKGTLEIIKKHQYYTESQKKLREKGRQKNIESLLSKIENIKKKDKAKYNPA